CVVGIRANVERCRQYAELTGQLVTAIAPVVGYDRAAELFKKAVARDVPIRQVLEDEKVIPKEEIARLLDLHQLARGGRAGGSRVGPGSCSSRWRAACASAVSRSEHSYVFAAR